jgi:DNA mismatch repair protein MutH
VTEGELLARARDLGGRTLEEVARRASIREVPKHKGAAGSLVERALGAPSGGSGPDFAELGVEVKTIPIDASGRPAESTFVCCAPRAPERGWAASAVRAKLARVLWVPVEAGRAWDERRIGAAFLWSPDREEEDVLQRDWEELSELLASGAELVSARIGRALQLRPKARDGSVRVRGADADGAPALARPRAFYLRRSFTTGVLSRLA